MVPGILKLNWSMTRGFGGRRDRVTYGPRAIDGSMSCYSADQVVVSLSGIFGGSS